MDSSQFLIIAGLILVNAFFVAAEFALVKVRTSQIDQMVEEGSWAARLTSKALDQLDVYLSASQIGITVASLALGRAIQDWVEPLVRIAFERLGRLPIVQQVFDWLTAAVPEPLPRDRARDRLVHPWRVQPALCRWPLSHW